MRSTLFLILALPFGLTACPSDGSGSGSGSGGTGGYAPPPGGSGPVLDCGSAPEREQATAQAIGTNTGAMWGLLVSDDANIYFAKYGDDTDDVVRFPKSGGAPSVIATFERVEDIVLDADSVFVKHADGVAKINKAGGAASQVFDGHLSDEFISVDDRFVYGLDSEWGCSSGDNEILAIDKATGENATVATDLDCVTAMISDGTYLYYTVGPIEARSIQRVSRTGGQPETLVESSFASSELVLGDTHLHYARVNNTESIPWTDNTVMRLSKAGGAPEAMTGDCEWAFGFKGGDDRLYYLNGAVGLMRLGFDGSFAHIQAPDPINPFDGDFVVEGKTIYLLESWLSDLDEGTVWKIDRP